LPRLAAPFEYINDFIPASEMKRAGSSSRNLNDALTWQDAEFEMTFQDSSICSVQIPIPLVPRDKGDHDGFKCQFLAIPMNGADGQ
jgi:hypothetical protein